MNTLELHENLNVLNRLNVIYSDFKQFEKAYKLHELLNKILDSGNPSVDMISPGLKGIVYLDMGVAYMNGGLEDKALEYFFKALKLFALPADAMVIANTKRNIGTIFIWQENLSGAENYFKEALEIYQQKQDFASMGLIYQNLGVIAHHNDDFELFRKYSEQALALYRSTGDKKQQGQVSLNLGTMYLETDQLPEAFEKSRESLRLFVESGQIQSQGMAYLNLGLISLAAGSYEQAKDYIKRGTTIILEFPEDVPAVEKIIDVTGDYIRVTSDR